ERNRKPQCERGTPSGRRPPRPGRRAAGPDPCRTPAADHRPEAGQGNALLGEAAGQKAAV
ncbi:MAG: hypothetical protein AVDCRST_MAG83-3629, partial [uncultured Arthrobacter sp.]